MESIYFLNPPESKAPCTLQCTLGMYVLETSILKVSPRAYYPDYTILTDSLVDIPEKVEVGFIRSGLYQTP